VDLCLFFIGLIGWNEDVVEEKESSDDKRSSEKLCD